MQKLFILSLNDRVRTIKPRIISMLDTIKLSSKGNLFADLKLITDYVLPKLNTLAAIELQLSELNRNYDKVKIEKQALDDELRIKIGEITGLTDQINEKLREIDKVKSELMNRNTELDSLKLDLKQVTDELNVVKAEKEKLLDDRNKLILKINEQIAKFNNVDIHEVTDISEIPKLLLDIVKHLKQTNESDKKLFSLINIICNDFFSNFTNLHLNYEIKSLDDIDHMLQQINDELLVKINAIEHVLTKYSDLFSNNLLFEERLSKLDEFLENYNLLVNFKNDVQALL